MWSKRLSAKFEPAYHAFYDYESRTRVAEMPVIAKTRRKRPARATLETKALPMQARSRETFDAILNFAAEILALENSKTFSINAICERSGMTPPAVYRYFPNKYAVLKALAERLMQAEDETALNIMASSPLPRSESDVIDEVRERIENVVAITASFPGSVQILRALRTTPVMREVRRASTTRVAARWFERLRRIFPDSDPARLRRAAWFGLEVSTQLIELIVEGQCRAAGQQDEAMIEEIAAMLGRYYWQLGSPEFTASGKDI